MFASYLLYVITYYFFTEFNVKNDLYKSFTLLNFDTTLIAALLLVTVFFFLTDLAYQRWFDFEVEITHEDAKAKRPRSTKRKTTTLSHATNNSRQRII